MGSLNVSGEVECDLDRFVELVRSDPELVEQSFGCGSFLVDSLLLFDGCLIAERIPVMGGQELLFFPAQAVNRGTGATPFLAYDVFNHATLLANVLLESLAHFLRERDTGVFSLHSVLDCLGAVIFLRTGSVLASEEIAHQFHDSIASIISGVISGLIVRSIGD
ncbi:MAG: hypothetical protein QG596_191 [Actinomycetota bacterium]|nr:hypothetical protein [Actinomycetota bacterium]